MSKHSDKMQKKYKNVNTTRKYVPVNVMVAMATYYISPLNACAWLMLTHKNLHLYRQEERVVLGALLHAEIAMRAWPHADK